MVYVVDGLPEDADDFRYPGDAIEPEIQSELERALSGETVLPEKDLDYRLGKYFYCLLFRCIMNQEKSSVHLE